jgi:hypothetical protein
MNKRLREQDITAIVDMIRGWKKDKITWQMICTASGKLLSGIPTRQALQAHKPIKEAYLVRRDNLKVHDTNLSHPSSLAIAAQRISRQQSIIDELTRKNQALMEQFVRWQYNAYKHGLKEHQLNEPLPHIDRDRTEDSK